MAAADRLVPAVISTWAFGQRANAEAWKTLAAGGSALDAVERGVNQIELDPENLSVGFGGLPDEEGEVTQDAIIFWGPDARGGCGRAASSGSSARSAWPARSWRRPATPCWWVTTPPASPPRWAFARSSAPLLTERRAAKWEEWKANPRRATSWNHDTIGMVAIDRAGDLCVGTSTSGLGFKLKGRVGDVAIPGAGAYLDNDVGGVAATGNGDVMMRFAPGDLRRRADAAGRLAGRGLRPLAGPHRGQGLPGARPRWWPSTRRASSAPPASAIPPFPYAVRNATTDEVRQA